MAEATPAAASSPPPVDIASHLPLHLIKSEIIPPAPSRSGSGSASAADFLLDFAGHSWIAYGAASLVVVSHFPNPISEAETEIGPVYRQVIEISREADARVTAVCWSPVTPSVGELAVALGDRIVLLSYNEDEKSRSSFCWRQTTVLVQSMKVEAIQWTGSGDGIISGGIDVVMWKRKEDSWERAWSFKPEIPQALVSTTWSMIGLSATAPSRDLQVGGSSALPNDPRDCVIVFQFDGHRKCSQHELQHPMPVRMIQWRPSTGKLSSRHLRQAQRSVLLTCCVDGVVRLWGEIDDGRIKRTGKDNDQKTTKLSFCVLAVIEVNQTLNGNLGYDIFVSWAMEVEGVALIDKEVCYHPCLDNLQHDTATRCEWLICFGPKSMITMWAIHRLDDFAPVRFPRVTLWKQQDLINSVTETSHLLSHKVLIMRNQVSESPALCLSVQLSPSTSFLWYQLHSQTASANLEGEFASDSHTKSSLTACAKGLLEVDGHRGRILQIAIHPFPFEVELAASLDRNGMLIFWSFSTFFNSHIGLPISTPSWKICGKIDVVDHSPNYTCLSWAPTVLDNIHVLLMGHSKGIDCFMVKILMKNNKHKIAFHNIFSLPFMIGGHEQGLTKVSSIPLSSICNGNSVSSKFLLIALWVDNFLALSWEVTIHSYDSQGSCSNEHWKTYESDFYGNKYLVTVDPCSSVIPITNNDEKFTSCAVICPSDLVSSVEQMPTSGNEICSTCYPYHMLTGSSNGSLKLWRSTPAPSLSSDTKWALVGALTSQQGPILAVSPSPCGQKIASASKTILPSFSTILCIWDCMHVKSSGSFMLEAKLCFDGDIVAFNWLRLGIGQLLLALCLQNEVRIYASKRQGGQGVLKSEKPLEENAWICIAVNSNLPPIIDFLWGPKGTAIVVHDKYFSLFSHFLSLSDCSGSYNRAYCPDFTDSTTRTPVTLGGQYESQPPTKMNNDNDLKSITIKCFWSMSEIAEMIGGSLPLFHPEALLNNLFSGNCKRAFTALRHLVKTLASSSLSEQGHGAKMPSSSIGSSVPLADYLEGHLPLNSSDKLFQWNNSQLQSGLFNFSMGDDHYAPSSALNSSLPKSEFDDFAESVERLYSSTRINLVEKMQALALIDLLREVGNANLTSAYGSLDEPGRRFWVAVRLQQLYFAKRFRRSPLVEEFVVNPGLVGWAFHSDCHDNLFNSLLSTEPSWEEMRSMGVGFWYTNVSQLRVKMEKLARQRYLKNKDPKACTLLYIALNRLQVLAGLFKISKDDKDKPLAGFLCRNFQEDQHKAAAIKNAYVLLGKHQLELAVAFFLLGGDASSAVTVCAKNLGDEQLALVICRLIEGCGGHLEKNLVLNFLLPSALSKGDFWMASFLECLLGNYSQSFFRMLGVEAGPEVNISALSSSHTCFLDPSIGQYCLMLGTKTNMKNAIGELNAAILCQWASVMTITSFRRCGLPLEALESLLSSVSISGGPTHGNLRHSSTGDLPAELEKLSTYENSSNWISEESSCHIRSYFKLNLALQYISTLMKDHPSCLYNDRRSLRDTINLEVARRDFENLLKEFEEKLTGAITYFRKKFSVVPLHVISMVVLSLYHNGLEFIGHYLLQDYTPKLLSQENSDVPDNLFRFPANLLKATEEMFPPYVKYVLASCKNSSQPTYLMRNNLASEGRLCWLAAWGFSNQGIEQMFRYLRSMLQLFLGSQAIDFQKLFLFILSLFEYHMLFASACLQKNFKAIIVTIGPIMLKLMGESDPYELKMEDLNKLITETVKMLAHDLLFFELGQHLAIVGEKQEPAEAVPDDKAWHFVTAAFWVHMTNFLEHQFSTLSEVLNRNGSTQSLTVSELDGNYLQQQAGMASSTLVQSLKLICSDISFYCSKQVATILLQEVNISNRKNISCFEDGLSLTGGDNKHLISEYAKLLDNDNKLLDLEELWHICAGLKIIHGAFKQEYCNWLTYFKQRSASGWSDAYASITADFESDETWEKEDEFGSPRAIGSPLATLSPDHHFQTSGDDDTFDSKRVMPFQNPKEIYRRNGELLEALCINSTDQSQAALASNRKGIVFFNWEDGILDRYKAECIWAEADWPCNGWAGSESTPVPTYLPSRVGLGSKKGTHLGVVGATIGTGSLARPGGELTGGGAFGIPGYAGIGASNLDWGFQESFDEFLDPPATVDNVRTGAFASHPCRPFFLVGSSNTHVYLWEFGKERATATYGVLPAANVPPPYALASVSAVRFDHCGQRFVTAALDGTVCTWQLEVGGRINVRPTESSVCFNNHTADVTYVTASGSIVAAAGYNSNGVNVVVWDTLAPPATSQASIMCHEGGARALAVFDNDIGSGSVSPLILTGGKGGDVGLHDFRYIATGRSKKQRHLDPGDHNMNASSSVDMRSKTGDQNRNGMLWYIPKAHSGCVAKITTIPNTSFFLTGSKDGDVKLWDAKRAKLVFHWPKLHERHTFMQPSSRGFGGVFRAAVTDIQVVSDGFLTCGGDGAVKHVRFQDNPLWTTN